MAAYIGSVVFPYPLKWENKDARVVMGKAMRARDGTLIRVRPHSVSQSQRIAVVRFEMITAEQVKTLRNMALTHGPYPADLEDTGDVVTVEFAPGQPIEDENWAFGADLVRAQVEGGHTDLWNGTLHLIIVN